MYSLKDKSLQKIFLGLLIVTAISGPAFLSLPIGGFHIFPFRVVLVLFWVFFILSILMRRGKLNLTYIKVKHYLLFLLAWFCYAILTLAWASSKTAAMEDIIFLLTGISIVFFLVYFLNSIKFFKKLYLLWIVILSILIGIGFWEHLTGQHLAVSTFFNETRNRFRFIPTGAFYNPNDFAIYLTLTAPFLISLFHYAKNKTEKVFAAGLLSANFYLILATQSRANLLALCLIFFVLFFFLCKLSRKIKIAFTIGLILFALFLLFPNFIQDISEQLKFQFSSLTSSYQWTKGSMINRVNLAKNALYYLYKSCGFGVGAGNIEVHIHNFAPYWVRPGLANLHNWWMEILSEYGIFIFFSYLAFYFGSIYNLWKIWHKNLSRIEKILCETFLLTLIGFSIGSVSSSSIMAFKPQWILFGFALAFVNIYRLNLCTKTKNN